MRGKGVLAWLALGLAVLSGCETTRQQVKPPPMPEDYRTPPVADERYSQPPRFPRSSMNASGAMRRERVAAVPDPSTTNLSNGMPR